MTTRIEIRPAVTDDDLEAWRRVRRAVAPDEASPTTEQLRALGTPDRLLILAETRGILVGSGLADRSQISGGFVAPRILPEHRRRGAGSAVLAALFAHLVSLGFDTARAHAGDDGSFAFARRHGFEEIDQQVEHVRIVGELEPEPGPYEGVAFTTVAEQPELLERTFPLARAGVGDLPLASGTAQLTLNDWMTEEATRPDGSFVALADGAIVGYAGLLAFSDDATRAENGLTVVDRAWRGRGLAEALKRRQLAWASANGIREIVTWTQRGNETMQRLNVRLGYVPRSISRTMQRDLP
ncbi:MAG: GNAT family N-acetyltransferase [Chloroflexi bacterium]|nr:GNAT family N-acetyltransferase [Chloroflexota bacterium]